MNLKNNMMFLKGKNIIVSLFIIFLILISIVFFNLKLPGKELIYIAKSPSSMHTYGVINKGALNKTTNYIENQNKGLFFFGPKLHFDKGEYRIDFNIDVIKIDKNEPYVTIHIFRHDLAGNYHDVSQQVLDLNDFKKNPTVKFSTKGGVNHEVAFYISGEDSKLGVRSINIESTNSNIGYIFSKYFSIFIIFISILYLIKKSEEYLKLDNSIYLFLIIFLVYTILIFQPFIRYENIINTGDTPNYLILANYIEIYKTLHISSLEKIYNFNIYKELVPFEILDPLIHVHFNKTTGQFFPHHQNGYSLFIALLFLLAYKSIKVAMLLSAFCIAIGLVYIFRTLKKLEIKNAALIVLIFSISPPLIYYSFTIYTETIVFGIISMLTYYVFFESNLKKLVMTITSYLIIFLKFKYFFILLPFTLYTFLNFDKKNKIILTIGLMFVIVLYLYSTFLFTSSFLPSSWYGDSIENGQRTLYLTILTAISYLFDQRYGVLFVIPIAWVFILKIKDLTIFFKDKRLFVLVASIASYIALYAYSGSFGGEGPALRPFVPIWGMMIILLSILMKDYLYSKLLALTVSFGIIMMLTATFMVSYSNNFSFFYQYLLPTKIKSYQYLPTFWSFISSERKNK